MNDKFKSENFVKEKSHFLNLFSLALADNAVDPSELETLYNIGVEHNFEKEEIDFLINNPHKVKFVSPQTVQEIVKQIYDLTKLLLADGKIDIREIVSLRSFCEKVGINEAKVDSIIDFAIEAIKNGMEKEKVLITLIEIMEG